MRGAHVGIAGVSKEQLYRTVGLNLLDKDKCFSKRLFRESCVQNSGNFIKDLNDLGRNISRVVIIDNSPISYLYHPENAVSVTSWFDDPDDRELLNILPLMEELSKSDDVRTFLN
ncbi:hypothetical protein A3Q56_04983 [Intoshia linei]|uniref:Mitochondrial import inner membrane translocase subunit TIM50 n=1 Tax=Intoshia linei TaxID=1819745 RepID=A0A177B0P5_9BILA|nr:hypothetical protein A3Q56_04983 [Intoshia linei]